MSKYLQLKNQIQKLQQEAEVLRKRERTETITRIKEAIAAYEFTLEDLGYSAKTRKGLVKKVAVGASRRGLKAGNNSAKADKRGVVAPKYRDTATGATWTGRGKQPRWLTAAIQSGKKLEDFKI